MTGKPHNPLKSQGESKETTKEQGDRIDPTAIRRTAVDTVSGKANADDTPAAPGRGHPGNRGGVTAVDAQERPDRPGVKTEGPSPADEPSSERTGTAPDRSGGSRRTGKTKGDRNI